MGRTPSHEEPDVLAAIDAWLKVRAAAERRNHLIAATLGGMMVGALYKAAEVRCLPYGPPALVALGVSGLAIAVANGLGLAGDHRRMNAIAAEWIGRKVPRELFTESPWFGWMSPALGLVFCGVLVGIARQVPDPGECAKPAAHASPPAVRATPAPPSPADPPSRRDDPS